MQQLNSKPLDQQEDVELEVDNQTESSGKIMWYVVTPSCCRFSTYHIFAL